MYIILGSKGLPPKTSDNQLMILKYSCDLFCVVICLFCQTESTQNEFPSFLCVISLFVISGKEKLVGFKNKRKLDF